MERKSVAAIVVILILLVSTSIYQSSAAREPVTPLDVMDRLVEIIAKLWSGPDSVKNDTQNLKETVNTLASKIDSIDSQVQDTTQILAYSHGSFAIQTNESSTEPIQNGTVKTDQPAIFTVTVWARYGEDLDEVRIYFLPTIPHTFEDWRLLKILNDHDRIRPITHTDPYFGTTLTIAGYGVNLVYDYWGPFGMEVVFTILVQGTPGTYVYVGQGW